MKALVTGASGFLGSHIVQTLRDAGHEVHGLVRTPAKASLVESLGGQPVLGDVTEPQSLQRAMQGFDVVVHAAARVTDWGDWPEFESATVQGTENVLRAAAESGVKRFVHISTVAVYDDRVTRKNRIITEDVPHGDRGDRTHGNYARAKVLAEQAVWRYHQRGDLEATALRPALVYGPRDQTTLPRLVEYLRSSTATWIGRGNPTIDPIFVTDVARCALAAATSESAAGQAYNVAPSREIGVRDFWGLLCAQFDIKPPKWSIPHWCISGVAVLSEAAARAVHSRKPPTVTKAGVAIFAEDRHHDPSKAKRDLGWEARVDPTEGIRLTAEWMQQAGDVR